jgi:dienelactone hydrolase
MTVARTVEIPLPAGSVLDGDLVVPDGAVGVVVFAHGTGSSRFSPRNRKVAAKLQERSMATLLLDLLTAGEEVIDSRSGEYRFDIDLLAERLVAATTWVQRAPETAGLPIGYFGASTGAAAALVAAARQPGTIAAVVSRGGRPDLAGAALRVVTAPTLLLVGARDELVLELNRRAEAELRAPHRLDVVPGAGHLFEEPGTLDVVAAAASDWFAEHLAPRSP